MPLNLFSLQACYAYLVYAAIFTIASLSSVGLSASSINFYGDAALRYEDDYHLRVASRRERIRFTGHLGMEQEFKNGLSWDFRLSTGERDKQNVPTITVRQFTGGSYPDRTVFIDRSYMRYKSDSVDAYLGKIPWVLKRNTAIYWDSDLHPYGLAFSYNLNKSMQFDAAHLVPLDGQTATTGNLTYVSITYLFDLAGLSWAISPWYADFEGDTDTKYTSRDVEFDNRSVRLTATLKKGLFALGVDYGRAINDFDVTDQYKDEKTAWVAQLSYGQLKQKGDFKLMLRQLYIERFGVIEEFAQNSTSRFATSNYKGYEFRARRQMGKNWWFGTRFADTKNIKADPDSGLRETGRRFRIEGKYSF